MGLDPSRSDVDRIAPRGAVFISYASQDAEAAKKICDALRAEGVEVWFDQNELRGGDAWDVKIRGQIGSCALFVPLISANTQVRREGYFRLEWRLAAQRTHMMSERIAFLLPVTIDTTRDAEADVPGEFLAVQWTRLPGGEATPAFCARVRRLLSGEAARSEPSAVRAPDLPSEPRRKSVRPWLGPIIIGVVLVAATLTWQPWRDPRRALPSEGGADARVLVAKARALFDGGDDANRENFSLAEELLKRAVAADPSDGEAWAAYAQLSRIVVGLGYDRSPARLEAARTQAERAIKLAPDSLEAEFAMANFLTLQPGTRAEAEARLKQLAARAPSDKRVLRWLGYAVSWQGRLDEGLAWLDRAAALPGGDPIALADKANDLMFYHRFAEAREPIERSLATRPVGRALLAHPYWLLLWEGDLSAAQAALGRVPPALLLEDRGAYVAGLIWLMSREPEKCLGVLRAVPRSFFEDGYFTGPKGVLTGYAQSLAGRADAARAEWEAALKVVNARAEARPDDDALLLWRGWLHAALGQREESQAAWRIFREKAGPETVIGSRLIEAWSHLLLGDNDAAIGVIAGASGAANSRITWAMLENFSYFDPLRGDPRFQKVVAQARAAAAGLGVRKAKP